MSIFTRNKQDAKTPLDETIEDLHMQMESLTIEEKEYTTAVDNLVKLYEVKGKYEKPNNVSKDVLYATIGNLLGIGMILGFEQTHVVTTKALSFVMKPRM